MRRHSAVEMSGSGHASPVVSGGQVVKDRGARRCQRRITELLGAADIRINGDRPWDPRIHTEAFYPRVMSQGTLGLGEAYMDGWWDCPALDEFVHRALTADLDAEIRPWRDGLHVLWAKLVNLQTRERAFEVGEQHYDVGNDLYRRMLGKRLIYSCGYWKAADNLDDAQEAKLDLACRKLGLEPGMRVLDIGCGWGETARFMAERYGVEVTGVTISREQARFGQALCEGLPVDIRLQDYRDVDERFDRIVSIGMFEHVGYKNYPVFMDVARRLLADDGLMLLHTIGGLRSAARTDPWIERYIFPNSMLPSARQISDATEGRFVTEDWHNFGADYDRTLMAWHDNFRQHWPELEARYGERFRRMWEFYLLSCAASFRARRNQLWQIVLSPRGIPGGYRAPR